MNARVVLALVALAAVVSRPARAQEACVDSVERALGALAGIWDVRAVFRSGSAWDTSAAEARFERDLGGCVLRETLVGTRWGRSFHVLSLWGAAGLDAPLQRSTVHSQHGLITVSAGSRTADGVVLVDSQVVRGRLVRFEHRFEPFASDSMRFTSRRSTDGGATWVVTWYADYLRRAR